MNSRTQAYHAARAKSIPDYYKKLEFDTLDMMGLSDEDLADLMSPEEIQEFQDYLAHRDPANGPQVWSLSYWLAEMTELPLRDIFTPAEVLDYKRLLKEHAPDYPQKWSFAHLWMMGVTDSDLDEIMTPTEKSEYQKFAERTTHYHGLGIETYLSDTTPEELVNTGDYVFVHDDEQNGFTISPEGELLNLVSWNHMGSRSIETAVSCGASKFTCYALYLPQYLSRFGFIEESRSPNPLSGAADIVLMVRKADPVTPA